MFEVSVWHNSIHIYKGLLKQFLQVAEMRPVKPNLNRKMLSGGMHGVHLSSQ
jgi:hypothetical protein